MFESHDYIPYHHAALYQKSCVLHDSDENAGLFCKYQAEK